MMDWSKCLTKWYRKLKFQIDSKYVFSAITTTFCKMGVGWGLFQRIKSLITRN